MEPGQIPHVGAHKSGGASAHGRPFEHTRPTAWARRDQLGGDAHLGAQGYFTRPGRRRPASNLTAVPSAPALGAARREAGVQPVYQLASYLRPLRDQDRVVSSVPGRPVSGQYMRPADALEGGANRFDSPP